LPFQAGLGISIDASKEGKGDVQVLKRHLASATSPQQGKVTTELLTL
jgi:hypothetical protein